jgi:hypothetical protein
MWYDMKTIMKHTLRHLFLIESISECERQAHGTRVHEKYSRHQNENSYTKCESKFCVLVVVIHIFVCLQHKTETSLFLCF